jgi:hypothetical protein
MDIYMGGEYLNVLGRTEHIKRSNTHQFADEIL